MKKLFALVIVMTAVFTLIGCRSSNDIDSSGSIFDDKDTLIGYSALSSVMTLHNNVDETAYYNSGPVNLSEHTEDDTFAILSEVEALTPYLDIVSTFMGGGRNFDVNVVDSSHEDYNHEMNITTVNMEGNTVTYTLYYNETFENEDDEDFDPEEFDSEIEGIMIIDDEIYTLSGKRQIQEGEDELELTAKLDDDNYVTLDYEIESDSEGRSVEFDYEMYRDGELWMLIEIDFQEDDEETEISLKFIKGTRESEYEFEIEIDEDNKRTIDIEYKISEDGNVIEEGEAEVEITYNEETSQYVVRYTIKTNGEETTVDVDYHQPE